MSERLVVLLHIRITHTHIHIYCGFIIRNHVHARAPRPAFGRAYDDSRRRFMPRVRCASTTLFAKGTIAPVSRSR